MSNLAPQALAKSPRNAQFWHSRWASKETLCLRDEVMRSLGDSNANLSEVIIDRANQLLDLYLDQDIHWTPIMLCRDLSNASSEFYQMALKTKP